ncbi:hypothetical protein GGR51DRAFT_511119 [Nemania sp. FL0031]|nr:hypothetical protein GGR51DRAFT_511119 [Nemania sp. FL0031]
MARRFHPVIYGFVWLVEYAIFIRWAIALSFTLYTRLARIHAKLHLRYGESEERRLWLLLSICALLRFLAMNRFIREQ